MAYKRGTLSHRNEKGKGSAKKYKDLYPSAPETTPTGADITEQEYEAVKRKIQVSKTETEGRILMAKCFCRRRQHILKESENAFTLVEEFPPLKCFVGVSQSRNPCTG